MTAKEQQQIEDGLLSSEQKPQVEAIRQLKKLLGKKLQGIVGKRANYAARKDWRETFEELFQELVERLYEELAKGVIIENMSVWCLTVARNLMVTWGKWESTWAKRHTEVKEDVMDDAEERKEYEERHGLLWDAWRKLGDKCKDLLWEKYWRGKQWKEVAAERQQKAGTIRKAAYACIQSLKKFYQQVKPS